MILPSISNQWPVSTQIHTIRKDKQNDTISAGVNLPQHPNEILKLENVDINSTFIICTSQRAQTFVNIKWTGQSHSNIRVKLHFCLLILQISSSFADDRYCLLVTTTVLKFSGEDVNFSVCQTECSHDFNLALGMRTLPQAITRLIPTCNLKLWGFYIKLCGFGNKTPLMLFNILRYY